MASQPDDFRVIYLRVPPAMADELRQLAAVRKAKRKKPASINRICTVAIGEALARAVFNGEIPAPVPDPTDEA